MPDANQEKKSERLEVRLGYQEKTEFVEACETQGDTPSSALRRFIKGYVRRSDEDVLSSAWRGAAKRRSWRPVIFTSIFITIAGLFWGLSQGVSDDAIFSAKDINGDGELEYAEHAIPPGLNDEPNGVLRVLDVDASGTISRAEFVQKGRMVYFVQEESSDASLDKKRKGMTLVEFKFTKERATSGTYEGATINAQGLDRLVIWPVEGAPSIMEGRVSIAMGIENIEFQADIVTMPEK